MLMRSRSEQGAPFDPAALSGGAATAPAPAPAAAPAPRAAASSTGAAAPTPAPAAALGNVFAELKQIDQSSGRTAGLRHVADAEKVYKNTSLRAGAAVPGESSAAAAKPRAAAAVAAAAEAKPPVCKKVPGQSRWVVEYQVRAVTLPRPVCAADAPRGARSVVRSRW